MLKLKCPKLLFMCLGGLGDNCLSRTAELIDSGQADALLFSECKLTELLALGGSPVFEELLPVPLLLPFLLALSPFLLALSQQLGILQAELLERRCPLLLCRLRVGSGSFNALNMLLNNSTGMRRGFLTEVVSEFDAVCPNSASRTWASSCIV